MQMMSRVDHTTKYITLPFEYVKCGETHNFRKCFKPRDVPPKCLHREGQHTANYKRCPAYKKMTKPPSAIKPRSQSIRSHGV